MPAVFYSQNFNSEVEAIINTNDNKNDILEVTGIAQNKTNVSYGLRYELSVITSNPQLTNNSSKNSQSGFFTLDPYQTNKLSSISVSVDPRMQTIILLLIYNEDDKLLGTARKVYKASSQIQSTQKENLSYKKENEGIQLYGLVTESTKTKPGKDFYDFFYQKYQLSQNPENKIIEIDEMISFGRTTRIMVKIENQIIFQFFSRPKLDYLEEMAGIALQRVNRYFQELRKQKQQITQY
ncbi:CsgE family curli-type amyloid fiber assembly protein [Salegentibacter sp. Hel_I_6]|uniref:CsgE family curli-type amyloid fiber assembly protein n=1 Tax=Salegentibacter sp. Hel_I_6 TaxID=1250278 RepID=UPI00055E2EB5|nr:CsgE family curli-type amyloid fiber assembly protein [Salegentibacter sp. Hel_I_6]